MAYWTGFLVLSIVVTLGVIGLARSSAAVVGSDRVHSIDGRVLRWNVVVSQGLVALVVLAGAWIAGIPWAAFGFPPIGGMGVGVPAVGALTRPLLLGVGLGLLVSAGNLLLEHVVDAPALRDAEAVRQVLAPASVAGWASLLLVVIPVIAVSEELLFRGALVGAVAAGFAVSPWALVAMASLAFGAAHTAQGSIGVIVTSVFGAILGGAFVLTGNLLVVIVAHWVVDTVEFLVHDGPFSRRVSRP